MGPAVCVNCSIISSDQLVLMKHPARGSVLLFPFFSRCYWLACQTALRGFDRTQDKLGEKVAGQNHDNNHLRLHRVVTISVETLLAFSPEILSGPHVAGSNLVSPCV